ncbi:MAG: hypothetical protein AB7T06_13245 [Kofleriaceae bacterium]
MRNKVFLLALLAGCNWTEFDDLEGDTWISVQGQPNDDSTDFGVALARGARDTAPGAGGSIVALGTGQAQYMRLVYSANGSVSVESALELNAQFGVGNLDPQPVLVPDPATDEVGLVATTGGDQVTVLHGDENLVDRQLFGPRQAFAATYMIAPVAGMPGMVTPSYPIVAAGPDEVTSALFPGPFVGYPNPAPKCNLTEDDGDPVNIRGVGAAFVTSSMYHDVVVWTTAGDLYTYDGLVFAAQNGTACPGSATEGTATPLTTKPVAATGFMPGRGSQIVMFQNRYALLVGHKDLNNPESYLALWDLGEVGSTGAPVQLGATIAVPGLRTAAILENGTDTYVVAGYPNETFDGVQAGRVQVYAFNTTDGLTAESVLTLHDASPESGQQFGRAIAVTEFNGTPVIAVAADNEVFLYFRTALYGETREGK